MPGRPVYFINSPFYRAKETGAIVASAVGIKEDSPYFEINNNLRERSFGKDLELKKASGGVHRKEKGLAQTSWQKSVFALHHNMLLYV